VFRNRIETLVSDAVVEAENIVPEIRRSLKKQSQAEPRRIVERKQPIRELGSKTTGTIGESLPLR